MTCVSTLAWGLSQEGYHKHQITVSTPFYLPHNLLEDWPPSNLIRLAGALCTSLFWPLE